MAKQHKCRRCKTLLDRSEHIVFSHFEPRRERIRQDMDDPFPMYHTAQDATYKHVPCSHCGEPEPLKTVAANLAGILIYGGIVVSVLGGAIWMIFFL